jgi:hypothetical protein
MIAKKVKKEEPKVEGKEVVSAKPELSSESEPSVKHETAYRHFEAEKEKD